MPGRIRAVLEINAKITASQLTEAISKQTADIVARLDAKINQVRLEILEEVKQVNSSAPMQLNIIQKKLVTKKSWKPWKQNVCSAALQTTPNSRETVHRLSKFLIFLFQPALTLNVLF
jgi:hypothetical protein